MTDAPPPNVPAASSSRKGISPLALIALIVGTLVVIGFVGLFVLGVFLWRAGQEVVDQATGERSLTEFLEALDENPARAAAEAMVRLNPELEMVDTNDGAGTITIRNTSTGEKATLNFEDIAAGRFSITNDEGEFSVNAQGGEGGALTVTGTDGTMAFGGAATLDNVPDWIPTYPGVTDLQVAYQGTDGNSLTGTISGGTTDDPQAVLDYYARVLEGSGYDIGGRTLTESGPSSFGSISASNVSIGRNVNVAVLGENDATQVTVTYNEEN